MKPKKKLDREALKQSWSDVHPGIPQHQRIDLCLSRLVDALCDQLEGK